MFHNIRQINQMYSESYKLIYLRIISAHKKASPDFDNIVMEYLGHTVARLLLSQFSVVCVTFPVRGIFELAPVLVRFFFSNIPLGIQQLPLDSPHKGQSCANRFLYHTTRIRRKDVDIIVAIRKILRASTGPSKCSNCCLYLLCKMM